MKNKAEQKTPLLTKVAESPWVQGPFLGAGANILVTPLL